MLHEKGLLCFSDNRSPTVPHSAHSLRRTGEEGWLPILACITRREVQYLAQQDTKSTYSEIADFHTKQETKKKHQKHDRKTAHGTTADFVFFAGWTSTCWPFIFYHANFAGKESPLWKVRIVRVLALDTYSWDYHLFTVLHHDGERANRTRKGASPHSASRAADKNIVFTTTRYILFAHRRSDVGCLGFVLAPLP